MNADGQILRHQPIKFVKYGAHLLARRYINILNACANHRRLGVPSDGNTFRLNRIRREQIAGEISFCSCKLACSNNSLL